MNIEQNYEDLEVAENEAEDMDFDDEDNIEDEPHSIENMIDSILDKNFKDAGDIFNNELSAKLQDAIDDKKVALADVMFNGKEEETFDDIEITDEDIEEYMEDIEDEDI